ncbi:MAG: hypothetical protein M0P97_04665 [Candidatus Moranbacteria bacterium]|jgi:hypothetical protein|nr:hypothetical protein [Candidatus Moranbacteria bacterium]
MEKSPKYEAVSSEILSVKEKEIIERHFNGERKLSSDYVNAITELHAQCYPENGDVQFEKMIPLESYGEYLKNNYPASYQQYAMHLSNPETVAMMDEIISTFNSDLERIKKEKDARAVKDFLRVAIDLVLNKK